MDNLPRKKKPMITISLLTTFSNTFSSDRTTNLTKSPRNFQGDMVGLGIVAAMNDLGNSHETLSSANSLISPLSSPLPVVSSAKPAANFRTDLDLERSKLVDDLSESYTCVISHFGNHSTRRRVYFGDKLNGIEDSNARLLKSERSSALPVNDHVVEMEFLTTDFLTCCFLCKKKLHGLDIFMYRGEKAFCSVECRDKLINGEDCKELCRSEASPCSSASIGFLSGVAAA